jgi:hypothetical protein
MARMGQRLRKSLAVAASIAIFSLLGGCMNPVEIGPGNEEGEDCRLVSGQWECT